VKEFLFHKLIKEYTRQFFSFVSLVSRSNGKKQKKDVDIDKTFATLHEPLQFQKSSRDLLYHILAESATEMATAFNNNIKMHFLDRQFKYLQKMNPNHTKESLKKFQKEHNEQPHNIEIHPNLEKSIYYDLEAYPYRFVEYLYKFNKFNEESGEKLFSLCPLRRSYVPSSIRITSTALKALTRVDELSKEFKEQQKKIQLESQKNRRK